MPNTIQNLNNIDIIQTERLKLTPLHLDNLNRYLDIAKNMRKEKEKNPQYFLYTRFDDSVKDLKNAVKELITSTDKIKLPEIAKRYNICLQDETIIGYIGFLYNPQNEINSDLGIFLDPAYEHKGYAFEAEKYLLANYFVNYDDKIYLTIHPKNFPSYRLNTKCGAVKVAHTEESKYGSERDILIITRPQFIQTIFNKKFTTTTAEKQFLMNYLQNSKENSPTK